MKKILGLASKLARYSLLGYAVASALLVAAILAGAGVEKMTGKVLHPRLQAIGAAILGQAPPASTLLAEGAAAKEDEESAEGAGARKAAAAPEAPEPERIALDLRRELIKTAEEIRAWDGRVDLLSKDIKLGLEKVVQENQALDNYREAWKDIRDAILPVINQVCASRAGWKPLDAAQFEALVMDRKKAASAGAPPAGGLQFSDIIQELSQAGKKGAEESKFKTLLLELEKLPPEVLAAMLSGSSEGEGAGEGGAAGSAGARSKQEVRFLMGIQEATRSKVLKLIQEENPGKASSLFREILALGEKDSKP